MLDALESADAPDLHRRLAGLDPAAYNGFHLAYADGTFAGLTWSDGSVLRQERLEPGVHLITEQSRRRRRRRRPPAAGRVAGRARKACSSVEGWLALLSEHGPEPRAGTCVHADAVGYGTRSAFVLHRAASVDRSAAAWTESRPCTTAARDGTALLRSVGRW